LKQYSITTVTSPSPGSGRPDSWNFSSRHRSSRVWNALAAPSFSNAFGCGSPAARASEPFDAELYPPSALRSGAGRGSRAARMTGDAASPVRMPLPLDGRASNPRSAEIMPGGRYSTRAPAAAAASRPSTLAPRWPVADGGRARPAADCGREPGRDGTRSDGLAADAGRWPVVNGTPLELGIFAPCCSPDGMTGVWPSPISPLACSELRRLSHRREEQTR